MSGRRSAWNRVPCPKDVHTFTFAFTRIVKIPSNKCPHWAGSGGIVGCGTSIGARCNLDPFSSTPERPSGTPAGTPEAALPLPGPSCCVTQLRGVIPTRDHYIRIYTRQTLTSKPLGKWIQSTNLYNLFLSLWGSDTILSLR